VRLAATKSIGLFRATLPVLLARCRDIAPDVRTQALSRLATLKVKSLSVAQRWELIKNGLREREPAPRNTCLKLCAGWLESYQHDMQQVRPNDF